MAARKKAGKKAGRSRPSARKGGAKKSAKRSAKRAPARKSAAKKKQPVIINGVRYHSLAAAANALGTNRCAIWQMVRRGKAEFE